MIDHMLNGYVLINELELSRLIDEYGQTDDVVSVEAEPQQASEPAKQEYKVDTEAEFIKWARTEKANLGRPVTRNEVEKWGRRNGISCDRARELQRSLPGDLRRTQGKPPTP